MLRLNNQNDDEMQAIREIATGGKDKAALMLNLNRYYERAGFSDGELFRSYMIALERLLSAVGARILWRHNVLGQPVGDQRLDEVLAIWYPSHQAFLNLYTAPESEANFRARALTVEYAVIHRFAGDVAPFAP